MKQITRMMLRGFELHDRAMRKAEFLACMETLVPWVGYLERAEGRKSPDAVMRHVGN